MDLPMETKATLRARIVALRRQREEHLARANACVGAIGELERLIEEPQPQEAATGADSAETTQHG